jgi:hypothetical protein
VSRCRNRKRPSPSLKTRRNTRSAQPKVCRRRWQSFQEKGGFVPGGVLPESAQDQRKHVPESGGGIFGSYGGREGENSSLSSNQETNLPVRALVKLSRGIGALSPPSPAKAPPPRPLRVFGCSFPLGAVGCSVKRGSSISSHGVFIYRDFLPPLLSGECPTVGAVRARGWRWAEGRG